MSWHDWKTLRAVRVRGREFPAGHRIGTNYPPTGGSILGLQVGLDLAPWTAADERAAAELHDPTIDAEEVVRDLETAIGLHLALHPPAARGAA